MKMAVFWNVAACSIIKFTDVSEALFVFIVTAPMMGAASTTETSVNFYKTTQPRRQPSSYSPL
jgi:hypothetical protein